jgi:hypothetical protein
MTRLLLAVAVCATLTGCPRWIVKPDPVPAQCDAICYVDDKTADDSSCASRARWEGDPKDAKAIDGLIYGTIPALRKETWTCGVRLKACQQCIDRLVKAGVVVKP